MKIEFFKKPGDFRNWLDQNHDLRDELWVGYFKKSTGKPSLTWPESVEQVLCFGWIDGLRKSIDEERYKIRFTPRRPNSHWSRINIELVEKLLAQGLMRPAGIAAYQKRDLNRSALASHEQQEVRLPKELESKIRKNVKAWNDFQNRARSYQKQCIWWIVSAKREQTRLNRLNLLIECCRNEKVLPQLRWSVRKKK